MTEHNKIFLDTNPVIYFIEENQAYYDRVVQFLSDNADADFFTSTITVAEYFPHPIREKRQDYMDAFNLFIESMDVKILDIDREIAKKSAQIRAEYTGFKTMDALQLATAVLSGCDLFYTNDRQLQQFREIEVRTAED